MSLVYHMRKDTNKHNGINDTGRSACMHYLDDCGVKPRVRVQHSGENIVKRFVT